MIKLFNIATSVSSQDRILYATEAARDLDFAASGGVTYDSSEYERANDLTFFIDVYSLPFGTNYNYAIFNGYHCFIDSAVEKDQNTTRLTLILDTITQYVQKDKLDQNKEVFIKRTHIDRFKLNGSFYEYDFDNSELLIKEDFNVEPVVVDDATTLLREPNQTVYDSLRWYVITSTNLNNIVTNGDRVEFENTGFALPNISYYIPMITKQGVVNNLVYFRDALEAIDSSFNYTGFLDNIIKEISTSDIIDVKIIPYLAVTTPWTIQIDSAGFPVVIVGNSSFVQQFKSGDVNTYMLTNLTHGELTELEAVTPSYILKHKPNIALSLIQSQNLEPKLFQYRKYLLNFLQGTKELYFDALQYDDLIVKINKSLNYATERTDIYVESGLYNNAKNTGAALSVVSDNTVSTNINNFDEYLSQKKVSSSAGYAYGIQAITGAVQTTVGGITQGGLGAGISAAQSLTNIVNTYVQRQDLKLSPDRLNSRGSNIINDIVLNDVFGITVTEVSLLAADENFIEKYLYYNGYKLNKFVTIYDIIDTRLKFNYIETLTSDNILNIGLSTNILQDIIGQFNSGIRFYKDFSILSAKPLINNERSL